MAHASCSSSSAAPGAGGLADAGRALRLLEAAYEGISPAAARRACVAHLERGDAADGVVGGERALFYGEVAFGALAALLRKHAASVRTPGGLRSFWDLGSGAARPVLGAALLLPGLATAGGIELVPGLHEQAVAARAAFEAEVRPALPPELAAVELRLLCGDFLADDAWAGGDFVLVNSTCFPAELVAALVARATALLRPGAVLALLSHEVPPDAAPSWDLLDEFERRMSWGPAVVRVYRRRQDDDGAAAS